MLILSRLTQLFPLLIGISVGFGALAEAGDYQDAVLEDKPIGYWRLEEAEGVADDSSPLGGDQGGLYVGDITQINGPILSEDENKAVSFDGTGRVEIPDGPEGGEIGSHTTFSIELWINPTPGIGGTQVIIGRGKFQTGVQYITRGLTLGVNGGAPGENANGPIPDGEWSHVVGVYDADVDANTTELTLYVNGFVSSTQTRVADNGGIFVPVPANNSFESIVIGALSFEQPPAGDGPEDFIQFFSGSVDEVAYYDYALGEDQILEHYEAAEVCIADEPGFEFACDDGFDNDCDGDVDGADDDCECAANEPDAEVSCDDGVDNDCDGTIDENDEDCSCTASEPGTEVSCDDGVDNDCDEVTDANDSDCDPRVGPFVRGDCDGNGVVGGSPTEAIVLLNFAFRGGKPPGCLAACDAEANGSLGITDGLRILRHSFLGIGMPDPPFPECTESTLAADLALGCETPFCAK